MLPVFVLFSALVEPVAWSEDHEPNDAEKPSPTPFHLGADASIKPGFAAHAIAGWIPLKHFGFNVCGRTAYEDEEGFYYEARGGPTFRFGRHGAWVVAPSFGFEHVDPEHETEPWSWRSGAMVAYTEHAFEAVGVVEYGGATGPWYSTTVNGWLHALGLGAYVQRDEGVGPWIGLRVRHAYSFWVAPVVQVPEDGQVGPGAVIGFEIVRH